VSLVVVAKDEVQLTQILETCEGSLTGCFYSDTNGSDDAMYQRLEPILRQKVGRLLNDKMPTGVTVSPATHHGGPFPAAWHPAFTAIGIPAALRRFTMLQCWENFRDSRLPVELRNKNLPKPIFRFIKGDWTKADLE
jgi:NADP-dependent aldehyde dehydrogenase